MIPAGASVRAGYYFNYDELDLIAVSGKAATLPGPEGQRYLRVPAPAAVALACLLGALFVFLMPLLGLFRLARRLGLATVPGAKRWVRGLLAVLTPKHRRGG